jgi:hypothetical protein
MNSVWQSLLWKEWREHRWMLFTLLTATLALVPLPWLVEWSERSADVIVGLLIVAVPIISMFLGAGIAAGEQSQRTIGFLQSLPVQMARPAFAKLLMALATLWTPCVLLLAAMQGWRWIGAKPVETIPPELSMLGYSLAASSLLIWMAATGVNLSDEIRAGAVGLLVILICWAALGLLLPGPGWNSPLWSRIAFAVAPAGILMPLAQFEAAGNARDQGWEYPWFWLLVGASVLSNVALAAWYLSRFGRIAAAHRPVREAPTPTVQSVWLAPPRRRPLTAILWKQARETLPLAALGMGAMLCIVMVLAVVEYRAERSLTVADFAHLASVICLMVGFFVAVVAGIGLFMEDLRPGLNTFWRSRPIHYDQWFGIKFSASALLTTGVLAIGPFLNLGLAIAAEWMRGGYELMASRVDDVMYVLGIGIVAQCAVFCVATAAMVLLRRPVLAALATVLIAACLVASVEMFSPSSGTTVGVIVALIALTSTSIAWLAVRNDWGWKH